eukprot:177561-Amphidinium_carterae.1
MGGLPPPTAATASDARGSDAASATRGTDADINPAHAGAAPEAGGAAGSPDQPMASGPEDLPEEGEQEVEGAELRPEKRARGRPRKRYLLDISHPLYFTGCSACAGLSYQRSKGCLRFRQNVNEDPAFAAR